MTHVFPPLSIQSIYGYLKYIHFKFIYACLYEYTVCVCVCVCPWGPEEDVGPPGSGVKAVVSYPVWVPGTGLRSSERTAGVLNH